MSEALPYFTLLFIFPNELIKAFGSIIKGKTKLESEMK